MSTERLREMLSEATPGPWHLQLAAELRLRTVKGAPDPERENDLGMGVAFNVEQADARLIALAPDAIALLADMGDYLASMRGGGKPERDPLLARLEGLCGDER